MDVFEEVDSEVAFRRRNEEEETEEGAREGPGKEALSTGETPEEGRVREAEDAAVRRALCAAMRADASGAMRRQSDLLTNLLMENGFDSWVGLEHLEVADVTALGATLGGEGLPHLKKEEWSGAKLTRRQSVPGPDYSGFCV